MIIFISIKTNTCPVPTIRAKLIPPQVNSYWLHSLFISTMFKQQMNLFRAGLILNLTETEITAVSKPASCRINLYNMDYSED